MTPGVVFYLERSSVTDTQGKVTLSAKVNDVDLWSRVIQHFDGMELHKGKDFKSEIIAVLRDKTHTLAEQMDHMYEQNRQAAARAGQELEFLRDKVEEQQKELRELRAIAAAIGGGV